MNQKIPKKLAAYSLVREKILDGDPLLFWDGSILIVISGRSVVTHAGMAVWLTEVMCRRLRKQFPSLRPGLHCIHTVQGRGGVIDRLSELVARNPGRIEVRDVRHLAGDEPYDRKKAVAEIKKIVGKPYGWWAIIVAACLHLPVVRWVVRPLRDDKANGGLPFCSAAVGGAVRKGGVDPVINLADKFTEPGDLDHSPMLPGKWRLVPDVAILPGAEEAKNEPSS